MSMSLTDSVWLSLQDGRVESVIYFVRDQVERDSSHISQRAVGLV